MKGGTVPLFLINTNCQGVITVLEQEYSQFLNGRYINGILVARNYCNHDSWLQAELDSLTSLMQEGLADSHTYISGALGSSLFVYSYQTNPPAFMSVLFG